MFISHHRSLSKDAKVVFHQSDNDNDRRQLTQIRYLHPAHSILIMRQDGTANFLTSGQTVKFSEGVKILDVTSTGLILLDDGSLYEIDNEHSINSRPVAPSVYVKSVASTTGYNMCCSTENWVFTWGASTSGCLGVAPNIYEMKAPAFIGNDWSGDIKQIACSETHAVLCTENAIYGWGDNSMNQLSKESSIVFWTPQKLREFQDSKITHLAAGRMQTIFVLNGTEIHFQGILNSVFKADSSIKKLLAYADSSAALLEDGTVISWGAAPVILKPHSDSATEGGYGVLSMNTNRSLSSNDEGPESRLSSEQNNTTVPPHKVIDITFSDDNTEIYCLCALKTDSLTSKFLSHVRRGFRPGNLPSKSAAETAAHQVEVARILEAHRRAKEETLVEQKELDTVADWWNVALKVWHENSEITNDMMDMWKEHGLSRPARLVLWPTVIGNSVGITKSLYEDLKRVSNQESTDSSISMSNRDHITVKLDLPRTFPELEILSSDSPFTAECSQLLKAFCTLQPDIGYVQGMPFVAATLLMNMQPFNAFVCFSTIMRWPIMKALYKIDMQEIKKVFNIFHQYVNLNSPSLVQLFSDINFKPEIFLLDWFLTIFAKPLSLETTAAVWDIVFIEGQKGLFRAACAILIALEPQLKDRDFDGCVVVIQKGPKILNKTWFMKKIRSVRHPANIEELLSVFN